MLTRQQHKLLMFVHNFISTTGIAPSFDEMFKAMELKSKSSIHRLLDALVERGFIRRILHRARAIEVIKLPPDHQEPASSFAGIKFVVDPRVPEGEVWVNVRHHGRDIETKFAVGS